MDKVRLAVNGTLMRGLELEKNLLAVDAEFLREARTKKEYRLFSINDANPAMYRVSPEDPHACQVNVEVWGLSHEGLTQVLLGEPAGLTIGKVTLEDGEEVLGVVAEPIITQGQKEISAFGCWRKYTATLD